MSEEILFDILLWLPVVSLLHFKTVCKSWLALIESHMFVNEYLHHHKGEDALIASYHKLGKFRFCFLSGNKYEVYTHIDFNDQFCSTISPDGGLIKLVDSCNGIICLSNGWSREVALWNPALKQLKLLPKSSFPYQHCNLRDIDAQFTIISFGFDAKANDYKVLRIILHSTRPKTNQVEIYSLRTSLSWRIICKNVSLPFTYLHIGSDHAISRNGMCFWLGVDNQDHVLVAFDLRNETFQIMELPDSHEPKHSYSLDFLNGKLAYVLGYNLDTCFNNNFEIWVLNEFGVKDSWNKIYSIGPTPYIWEGLHPTGFSVNGEFLLLRTTFVSHFTDELFLYNLVTRGATQESYTPIQVPELRFLGFFLHYNESLVSLKI